MTHNVPTWDTRAQEGMDRSFLMERLWEKYRHAAKILSLPGDGVPLREAVSLLSHLLGDTEESVARARDVVRRKATPGTPVLGKEAFVQAFLDGTESLEDRLLYLEIATHTGVHAISRETAALLGRLYDAVVSESNGSSEFTVPLLAALCEELGFGYLEDEARDFLTDTEAIQTGRVAMSPNDWLVVEPPSQLVQRRKKFGEQTPDELARIAEEIARASQSLTGVSPSPGTDWADVRRQADERAARAETPNTFREFLKGGDPVSEDEVRRLRERSRIVVRSHKRVPITKGEFVTFVSSVAAGMGEEELRKYVEVFFFMAGIRDATAPSAV